MHMCVQGVFIFLVSRSKVSDSVSLSSRKHRHQSLANSGKVFRVTCIIDLVSKGTGHQSHALTDPGISSKLSLKKSCQNTANYFVNGTFWFFLNFLNPHRLIKKQMFCTRNYQKVVVWPKHFTHLTANRQHLESRTRHIVWFSFMPHLFVWL